MLKNRGKMRIVYLSDTIARFGGIERVFVDKMNFLTEEYGHEIYLITSSQKNHKLLFPPSPKIRHIDLGINFHSLYQYHTPIRLWMMCKLNRLYKKRLKKAIRDIKPDFIITETRWKASLVCNLPVEGKKIIESHLAKAYTGEAETRGKSFLKKAIALFIQRRTFHSIVKKCDIFVTLTQGDATDWNIPHKTHVIPNPFTIYPDCHSRLTAKKIISVGRLDWQKGYDMLIDVWRKVYAAHPDWQLHIYGNGPDQEFLEQKVNEHKLGGSLFIHPSQLSIYEKYLESSIYVMSSRYEGFGLVLVEAMACGLPCVSFDCPYGPADIIKNGEDGFLIENNHIGQMAEKINYLIENESERFRMGEQARENVRRFSKENIMKKWDRLFRSL